MFTEHLSDESRPYRLNFIMEKAERDLDDLIEGLESKEMELDEFYTVFISTILGLCYLHM